MARIFQLPPCLKVKATSAGTSITPVDIFTTTDVSGPQGSVLAKATGITLSAGTQGQVICLPVITRLKNYLHDALGVTPYEQTRPLAQPVDEADVEAILAGYFADESQPA